ncbi:MAG: hypothetical protein AB1483_11585 [Candidatus Zixiibacteriota bacterium]
MKNITRVFLTLTVAILSSNAFAQGEFLRPGESGLGLRGILSNGDYVDRAGVSIGATISRFADLCYSYSNNSDFEQRSHTGTITFYLRHGTDRSLFGVGLTGGFQSIEHSRYHYGALNSFLIGIAAFKNFYISEQVLLQPSLSSLFAFRTDNASDGVQGNIGGKLAVCLFHNKRLRPFVNIGIDLPDSWSTDYYTTLGAGLVAVI